MTGVSPEEIRERARELFARRGESAVTFAEWEAIALEESGRWDEARIWRMIAGTVLALIES